MYYAHHQHDLVYHAKCPSQLCDKYYVGESGRRIAERIKDHNGRDHKSHILKHSLETEHERVKKFLFFNHLQELQWKQNIAKNC